VSVLAFESPRSSVLRDEADPPAGNDGHLVLVACGSALVASRGRPAVRSVVVSTMPAMPTMSSMAAVAAVAEHMHGDEGDADQYPDPIC
jgi:hypothetical protein